MIYEEAFIEVIDINGNIITFSIDEDVESGFGPLV